MDSTKAYETIRSHERNVHAWENFARTSETPNRKSLEAKYEDKRILILLVILDGSPYQEGTEWRIRDRIAVISALGRSCFVPEDSEHIRYLGEGGEIKFVIPYEWFQPRKLRECNATKKFEKVLVLWLNNEPLAGAPLSMLKEVVESFEKIHSRLGTTAPLEFKVIGPEGSHTFQEKVEDDEPWKSLSSQRAKELELYSPWATISSPFLWARAPEKHRKGIDPEEYVKKRLEQRGVNLKWQISSDFQVAQALVKELKRRGVRFGDSDHRLIIISEWDTFYGRIIAQEFTAAACMEADGNGSFNAASKGIGTICDKHAQSLELLKDPDQLSHRDWLKRYFYLRGLDGEIQGKGGTGKDNEGNSPNTAKGEKAKQRKREYESFERPEGQSQLDYVRRLAGSIRDGERRTAANCSRLKIFREGCEIAAIGIFGMDVYDKSLVLQALRMEFPHAIFFTTDLDERLTHRDEYQWTRNLIIGSHFDLQLEEELQRGIPPFRSSYQTSAFLAVMLALGEIMEQANESLNCEGSPGDYVYTVLSGEKCFETAIPATLFEVSRTGRIVLNDNVSVGTGILVHPPYEAINFLWSRSGASFKTGEIKVNLDSLFLVLVAYGLALLLLSPLVKTSFQDIYKPIMVGINCLIIVWLGALMIFFRLSQVSGEEPFYWLEGVSIWPSELLRLAALFLSITFVCASAHLLKKNHEDIHNKYGLGMTGITINLPGHVWGWIRLPYWSINYRQCTVAGLWEEYGKLKQYQWRRIFPQAVTFWLFGMVLSVLFGMPHIPSRGNLSHVVDGLIVPLVVLAFLVLIFFVVDATRMCHAMIRKFKELLRQYPITLFSEAIVPITVEYSQVVTRLIYFPCIVLALMIIARLRVFDDWGFPVMLLVVWGISAVFAIGCTISLSRSAAQLKKAGIDWLAENLKRAKVSGSKEEASFLKLNLEHVKENEEGAFVPWIQHPVIRALLYPSGAYGIFSLLE